ncbi:acyl-CoA dehydrogenase family protein [Gammaproteobacteria bacterium]|jgi:alkylation response protein AidB-like acyl-CoA dehydrogenase|nr:acyl-CoA dehydrogenase family protein [Gammaproteobacteria bacterium]MDA9101922.1 acyl-CoA dehydrogenase family protein [Gammaproteobacteria bacterium]MDA9266133.1 acyl-CoA dehydrogenase family protein [Gammaproteobacteria bacterium]MDB2582655.1 acyl-CoA dehydrogenase family protein [Gammaproteobacteria bacterium]MDB4243795.1 acyl-CoA dehydrogenase family protein [Gammaproteobacteria bacterium]|tara:strand:- start:2471 stop:3664 length:1194 start_codon:yes stop_codon:yes gene_type:complete
MEQLENFRQEVKSWLDENCPASMRNGADPAIPTDEVWGGRKAQYKNPESKIWLDRMGQKGWTMPTVAKEYGGGGLSKEEVKILNEEMWMIGAKGPLLSFGIWMLAPVLLEYGTEEQKKEHLPKIIKGEIRWCQGYSEPGSGSDLASLATKAEDIGEHFLVNGQKVWTSYADKADWIFALVRTGPKEPKHDGISFLLIDMETQGVSTKPITLISGKSPFCETFFDDVKVTKANLIGELNAGWTIAKALLQHEREFISKFGLASAMGSGGKDIVSLAKKHLGEENGKISNGFYRSEITAHKIKEHAFGLTLKRAGDEGGKASPTASMFKLYGTEHNKMRHELMVAVTGINGVAWDGDEFDDDEKNLTKSWLRTKGNSLEGGTSEVQLNVISKRVLGLPS